MQTSAAGHCVFPTALGHVGLAFSAAGLTRLVLPQRDPKAVASRLVGADRQQVGPALPDAPAVSLPMRKVPGWVDQLLEAICAYAAGERIDFLDVSVDLDGVDDFRREIYDATRKLKFGETTTYGELARRAGHAGMARETGAALGANPVPLVIPCHRVLAAGGRIGGFSAPGGRITKQRMLALEGVQVGPRPKTDVACVLSDVRSRRRGRTAGIH